ncbi:polo like kinase 5 (inactive) [Phyllostomus discolor]|uniref:Polo like kinase 5 (Inactive) n=1 Tax=Phyllostomus discolor TaxID=89673 RepID=A0A833ZRH4_9CHIR|nr:polo like kinase 5 (inactive) [Phyllostomus discolor]
MEPRSRRRGSCRPLVSPFLRDPASGRVYKRGKLIGKGAFSRCYKLTDLSTSSVFALKVVPRRGAGAGGLRPCGKVEREIALHSRLRHHNIVAFHGHFADRDHVYMVLEYCSRQSLAHVLEARRTLTEPEVRYYLRGLVSGLRYLHQQHIVHRDLKLSNFFLKKNMEVKIGDLGLAAKVGPGGRCHRVLCGTPNFLAPEVVSRNGHSCQSDIWALGCVTYLVLTGSPPFMAAPLSEMYENILASRYPEPTHLSPNACRLIARLLAPNPAERPSLDHLLQDDFFTQAPILPMRPRVQEKMVQTLTSWSWALRLPYQREGLPSLRSQSTYSTKGPSRVTQLGLRGAQCRRWKRPLETCSSAWTLGLQDLIQHPTRH